MAIPLSVGVILFSTDYALYRQAQENFNLSQIFESEQTQSAALIHWDGEAQYATAGGSSSQTGQQQSQYSYQVALAGLYSVDYAAQLPPSEFAGPYDRYFSYAFGAEFGYPLVAPERLPDNRLYLPVSHSLPPLPSSGLANEHPISSPQDLNLDFDLFTPGFDSPLNPFDAYVSYPCVRGSFTECYTHQLSSPTSPSGPISRSYCTKLRATAAPSYRARDERPRRRQTSGCSVKTARAVERRIEAKGTEKEEQG